MSHLDFSIPATWVAISYIPITILLLFLLIKLGAQRSVIKAHERLNEALSEAHERLSEALSEATENHRQANGKLSKLIAQEVGKTAAIAIRARRQMESDQTELAKCIAASKRKDHEIEELNGRVNSLLGNSGEIPYLSAPRRPGINS